MTSRDQDEATRWATRAPDVPQAWFRRWSSLHGVRHTQRVHIHAQRLAGELAWPGADVDVLLRAALWHDIGRRGDGVEPSHGLGSVLRADELGFMTALRDEDAAVVRFAIERHSLADRDAEQHAAQLAVTDDRARRLADPARALRILWLLKDADALDRVRLGFGEAADPRQLRHPQTVALLGFAEALYAVMR
jgi:HD superfamily phosphodiesterase